MNRVQIAEEIAFNIRQRLPFIEAKQSRDLCERVTVYVEFDETRMAAAGFDSHTAKDVIYNDFPEISLQHAFDGLSGNCFEYVINEGNLC